jgi:hypothetical protein
MVSVTFATKILGVIPQRKRYIDQTRQETDEQGYGRSFLTLPRVEGIEHGDKTSAQQRGIQHRAGDVAHHFNRESFHR